GNEARTHYDGESRFRAWLPLRNERGAPARCRWNWSRVFTRRPSRVVDPVAGCCVDRTRRVRLKPDMTSGNVVRPSGLGRTFVLRSTVPAGVAQLVRARVSSARGLQFWSVRRPRFWAGRDGKEGKAGRVLCLCPGPPALPAFPSPSSLYESPGSRSRDDPALPPPPPGSHRGCGDIGRIRLRRLGLPSRGTR